MTGSGGADADVPSGAQGVDGEAVIARRLESMLLNEAPDPNRSRRLLVERVERGAAWA